MTVNDNLADSAARHTVYGLRWSTGTYRKRLNLIDTVMADLTNQLNIRAPASGSITEARLKAMLANIKESSASLYSALNAAVTGDYRELAVFESASQTAQIQSAYPIELKLNTIPPAQIHAATMSQPFRGRILKDWFAGQEIGFREKLSAELRMGFVEGQSLGQISSRMRGVGNIAKKDLDTIIRTATQHMAARARAFTVEANSEIFKGEEWSSTLDGRTSSICISLDGKVFPIGKGQYPPAHFNACTEGTKITTARGLVPIEDVKVGDYTLTHAGRWRKVTAVMAKHDKCKAIELINSFGTSVRLTEDHPVLTSIGYKCAGNIKIGDKLFDYGNKLLRFKNRVLGSLIKQGVLIDAHNMKTTVIESLVAYSVTSKTTGMSSSINLNDNVINKKIDNIFSDHLLIFKFNIARFKEVFKHFFVKCRVAFKGSRQ